MAWSMVVVAALLGQTGAPAPQDSNVRAAAAAERAAAAAERAAAAAESAAESARRIANAAAPAAAATAEAVPPAPAPSSWMSSVGLGLIALTGNAEALTFTANASVQYKSEHWILGTKAYALYGQSRPTGAVDTQVLALAAGLQLRGDRRISSVTSIYLLGGAETDHVKSVELRGYGEVGAAVVWIESKEADFTRAYLRTDLAARYAHESRFQYFPVDARGPLPSVELIAPRLGLAFRYALKKGVVLTEDAEVLPNVVGASRVLVNSLTKVATELTRAVALTVSVQVGHDSRPALGRKPTDTALSVGLEVAL